MQPYVLLAVCSVLCQEDQESERKQKSVGELTSHIAGVETSVFTNSHSLSTTESLPYTHKPTALQPEHLYQHEQETYQVDNPTFLARGRPISPNHHSNVNYVASNNDNFGLSGNSLYQDPSHFNYNQNVDEDDSGNYVYSNPPYIHRGLAFENEVVPKFAMRMPYLPSKHQPLLHHIVHSIRTHSSPPSSDHYQPFPVPPFNVLPHFPALPPYFPFD